MAPKPLCAHCQKVPVKKPGHRHCSIACGHAPMKVQRPLCACGCGRRVKVKRATYYDKRCAWMAKKGWELAAKGRVKADAVRRQRYVARLRERLKGATNAAQIWKVAYARGYAACYARWLRAIRRGDVVQVVRRDREIA